MKYFIFLLLLFIGFNSFGQFGFNSYNNASVTLRNGEVLEGEAKITNEDTVKFRDGKDKTTFDYKNLERVTIDADSIETYVYKIIGGKGPRLMKVILEDEGKINLYAIEFKNANNSMPLNGGLSPGGSTSSISFNVTEYYVNVKDNEHEVIKMGNNHPVFGKRHYKKTVNDFFKDCPELISQVEEGEMKRNRMIEIIKFYNENCGG